MSDQAKFYACRSGLFTVCLLTFAAFTASCSKPENALVDPPVRPNIILLMADDLGWGDPGYTGNPHLRTPNLDDMANSGLVFERFYSAAPVCSPTRASVLTGRHPFRSKIYYALNQDSPTPLARDEVTLGKLLKDAGYTTGFFGKWHLGSLTTEVVDARVGGAGFEHLYSPPWEHGFDTVFATESRVPTYDPMIRPRSQAGADAGRHPAEEQLEGTIRFRWQPLDDPDDGIFFGTHYWAESQEAVTENLSGDDSRVIMDRVIEFIEQNDGDEQPLFAVIWFHTPHLPLVAGLEDQAQYAEYTFTDRTYYAAVSAMDREIGRLRETLKERGMADDTVLWFASDNGPESSMNINPGQTGGLRGRKRSLYEGGIRVPGIIEWPARLGVRGKIDAPAVTSDIFPTVLAWAGVGAPADRLLDGIDLNAILLGEADSRNSPIGFESQYQLAWVDDRYKLIYVPTLDNDARLEARHGQNPDVNFDFELYDIVNDPGETRDISASHPEIVEQMSEQFAKWRSSVARSIEGNER
jgi:arylsulfatase A-like enzyme